MKENLQHYEHSQGHGSTALRVVEQRIQFLEIDQNEKLGQHFLIDDYSLSRMAQEVEPGANVIEVGAGVGQLTELLTQQADRVISIEIDRRYEAVLQQIQTQHPGLEIVYGDVLSTKLDTLVRKLESGEHNVQIVANLPYHITEPFMQQASRLHIPMSLMVGEKFAQTAVIENPNEPFYSSLSLLSQSFYEVERILDVPREAFIPEPRTKSAIMRFTPKGNVKHLSRQDFISQRLFLTINKSPLVKNVIKESLIAYSEVSRYGTRTKTESSRLSRRTTKQELKTLLHQYQFGIGSERDDNNNANEIGLTQNQARDIIGNMGISESILNKPFSQLNNSEIRILVLCLQGSGLR